jgi:hypothetical protein
MNSRRVARRVASMSQHQNPPIDGANARTLATKVLCCSLHPFPVGGRVAWCAVVVVERGLVVGIGGRGQGEAGVWLSSRRVASSNPRNTLHHTLIGNEKEEGKL